MLEKKKTYSSKGEEHTVKYRSIFLGSDNMCRNLREEGLFVETFLVLVWFREVVEVGFHTGTQTDICSTQSFSVAPERSIWIVNN